MSNPIKDFCEKESLRKGIAEREYIICNYQRTWFLDRDNAIKKIRELRINDRDVAEFTSASIAFSYVPFNQATDAQIVGELIKQRNLLTAKLIKKQLEEQNRV